MRPRYFYHLSKRLFDVIMCSVLVVLLMPLILITSLLIAATSRGPILYAQKRVGKDRKLFTCYKFRSMVHNADQKPYFEFLAQAFNNNYGSGAPKSHVEFKTKDQRLTKIGKIIRVLSIDELPQLINVIKGEMSLIGPRPDVPESVELYSEFEKKRLSVKPGISGLWQVSGRSNLTLRDMFVLDNLYVDNQSFLLDLQIFVRTIFVVMTMKGSG